MYNRFYLNDKNFLKQFDENVQKEKYARIVSLTNDEEPIEEIQGKVTGGSVSLDGTSAVRRTCSLTIVSQDININDFYWGLNTKFKLEIGFKNIINPKYPKMIWFPLGTYVITSFSESVQTNNHTINISGKDKMVLLNGEVGGHITSLTWDFGTIDETDETGKVVNKDIKLSDIIRDAVHEFAKEPLGNIIVNLDASGYNLLKYSGNEPVFFLFKSGSPDNIVAYNIGGEDYVLFDEKLIKYNELDSPANKGVYYNAVEAPMLDGLRYDFDGLAREASKVRLVKSNWVEIDEASFVSGQSYYKENDNYILDNNPIPLKDRQYYVKNYVWNEEVNARGEPVEYMIWKVDPGNPVGYQETDLIYAHKSDNDGLIMSVGETITAMLDKIVNQLGDYEYFYDIDGKFRFQRKKTYINSSFNNITKTIDNDVIVLDNVLSSSFTYTFEGNKLVSSFQNTPDLLNLRNDYSIWGKKQSASGTEYPIHLRYAIDEKPIYYKSLSGQVYCTDEEYLKNKFFKENREKFINKKRQELIEYYQKNDYEVITNIIAEDLKQEIMQKKENPNGLPEEWWEVVEWGEYYKKLNKGEFPQGALANYYPDTRTLPVINLNDYFPAPEEGKEYLNSSLDINSELLETQKLTVSSSNFGVHSTRIKVGIFDVNEDGTLGYYGHVSGCSHSYMHFVEWSNKGVHSYFFNPVLPHLDNSSFAVQEAQKIYLNYVNKDLNTYIKDILEADLETAYEEYYKNKRSIVDWRELIYQMAVDYRANYYSNPAYTDMVQYMNGKDEFGNWLYPQGRTKYEQYYTDIISFWRQLYCPKDEYYPIESGLNKKSFPYCTEKKLTKLTYEKQKYYYLENGIFIWTGYERYKEDRRYFILDGRFFTGVKIDNNTYKPFTYYFWDDVERCYRFDYYGTYNNQLEYFTHNNEYYYRIREDNIYKYFPANVYDSDLTYYKYYSGKTNDIYKPDDYGNGWSKKIVEAPEDLNFWFDFLDTDAEMAKYSVHAIGDRTKALNDDDVKAIYFREVPKVVFGEDEYLETDQSGSGYIHFKTSDYLENLFEITSQGKTAVDALTINFYNYSYCTETVSITAVPVYYLEPNTRVYIHDPETKINGEYLVSKITLPFEYNGSMSLNAIKAPRKLF